MAVQIFTSGADNPELTLTLEDSYSTKAVFNRSMDLASGTTEAQAKTLVGDIAACLQPAVKRMRFTEWVANTTFVKPTSGVKTELTTFNFTSSLANGGYACTSTLPAVRSECFTSPTSRTLIEYADLATSGTTDAEKAQMAVKAYIDAVLAGTIVVRDENGKQAAVYISASR